MNVKERVTELRAEQRAIEEKYHGWRAPFMGVSGSVWPNPARDEACARHKEIDDEIKELIYKRISDLRTEQIALKEKYPKFGMNLCYVFTGVPEEVEVAKKRYDEIDSEIRTLVSLSE